MRVTAFALLVAFVLAAGAARAAETSLVEIASKSGVHAFTVELVDNDADRAKGLMYRKSLPEGTGMLFDFQREQDVSFWMQNTYIPLDMVFIRADGTIARIAHAQPMNLDPVPAGEPVAAVLEIRGGRAAERGIREGDKVEWPH